MKLGCCVMALSCLLSTSVCAQGSVSGSWYNPMQSGHGVAMDQLSPDAALMLWSTYDGDGNPMPLYSEGSRSSGAFTGPAYAPSGPRFGDFAPDELVMAPWGTLSFDFEGCGVGRLRWDASTGPGASEFGIGETPMRPLVQLGCDAPPASSPLAGFSGTWYHPQMQGLGINVQVLDANSALLYWFTYDELGKPLPLYIEARIDGPRLSGTALAPRGMRFGSFARSDLQVQPFGSVEVEFHDCDSATLRYDTPLGADHFALTRLTRLQGIECTAAESRPDWAETLYTGSSFEFTFPDFETADAILLLNARDEVLLSTTGEQRLVRGQLRREGDRTFMQVHTDRADYDKEIQRDAASGELFVKFIEPGDPGLYPFEVTLRPAPVQPLPAPGAALAGTYGDLTTPFGTQVVIDQGGGIAYTQVSQDQPMIEAVGRVMRVDAASGVFDFDLRFAPSIGSADPAQDPRNNVRIFGSGALLREPNGDRLLLLGEGIARVPTPPAEIFRPERVHAILPRNPSR